MNAFLLAAAAMLVASLPCAVELVRGPPVAAVVAYEVLSSVAVMVLILVPQGFGRSGEFELPVLLALLLFGSGLVFVRALERWL
jgi:multisubunit Na+/H+ antiporter MnhF subunit